MVETNLISRALWHVGAGRSELRQSVLRPPGPHEALVRMLHSGISRGTERLVASGHVPPSEYEGMRCPFQQGYFPFPVKYGYCAVGVVEAGPHEWLGRNVFVLHPHQDRFVVPITALSALPDGLPTRRATLAANMETALNAVWDAGAGPGDRIAIVGAGVVGLLVAFVCAAIPGTDVTVADIALERAPIVASFGASFCDAKAPSESLGNCDIAFHCSASAAGLNLAIDSTGFEGRIVEMSWYGAQPIAAALGGAFHSRRLQLVSSQVGHVAHSRRARWTYARRLSKVLELLDDERLNQLVSQEVAFTELPALLAGLLAPAASGLATVVTY